MMQLNGRTLLYLGLITLSSALAALTHWGLGLITFGLIVLVFELARGRNRLSQRGGRRPVC